MHRDDVPSVICAARPDIDTVAALATHATRGHPLTSWLIPKAERRAELLRAWWRQLAEGCVAQGHVDVLADRSATAIWVDDAQLSPAGLRRHLAAFGPFAEAAELLADVLARQRPSQPHLRLAVLAVVPIRQRERRAKALLEHRHRSLDRDGTYAYVENATEGRLASFMSLGYEPGPRFHIPAGPTIWPMLRPPRGPDPQAARGEPFWPPDLD